MGQIWRLHLLLLPAMASITASSVVSVPSSFVGLRFSPADVNSNSNIVRSYATPFVPRRFPHLCVKASSSSLTESFGKAVAVVSAGVLVAGAAAGLGMGVASASAFDVLMGSNSGELIFIPSEFEVSAGETINFINNAGYPHNVVFDDDDGGVPAGVDPGSISMSKLLNGQNEKYSVVLKTPGKYAFYCEPHQGNGMEGKVTVK